METKIQTNALDGGISSVNRRKNDFHPETLKKIEEVINIQDPSSLDFMEAFVTFRKDYKKRSINPRRNNSGEFSNQLSVRWMHEIANAAHPEWENTSSWEKQYLLLWEKTLLALQKIEHSNPSMQEEGKKELVECYNAWIQKHIKPDESKTDQVPLSEKTASSKEAERPHIPLSQETHSRKEREKHFKHPGSAERIKGVLDKYKKFSQAFGSDILTVYQGNTKLWALPYPGTQDGRYWNEEWDKLGVKIQWALQNIESSKGETQEKGIQELGECYDEWIRLLTEKRRGDLNNNEVFHSKNSLMNQLLEKYREEDRTERKEQIMRLNEGTGTLTMKIFFQDTLKKIESWEITTPLPEPNTLYKYWLKNKIKEISDKTKDRQDFEKLLKGGKGNLASFKDKAMLEKQKVLSRPWISEEEAKAEIAAIDAQWQEEAAQLTGMLNPEDYIQAAFVGLSESDYQSNSNLFRKIQLIGKYSFWRENFQIDGMWGYQTQAVLIAIRDRGNVSDETNNTIIDILSKNKNYGKKAEKLALELREKKPVELFDEENTKISELLYPEKKTLNRKELPQRSEEKIEETPDTFLKNNRQESLVDALDNLSEDLVDESIPREVYLKMLTTFITGDTRAPNLADQELAKAILDDNGTGETFEQRKEAWGKSRERRDFLNTHKQQLSNDIQKKAKDNALKVTNTIFRQLGIRIQKSELRTTPTNQYFELMDNQGIIYHFTPSTGEIEVKEPLFLDKDQKSISLNSQESAFFFSVPSHTTLVNQATDIASYLPMGRVQTQAELDQMISEGLAEKIKHHIGSVEGKVIEENFEAHQLKHECRKTIKALFPLQEYQTLNGENHRSYYEIVAPILNTLNKAKTNADLQQVLSFLQTLQKQTQIENPSEQQKQDHPILSILSKAVAKEDIRKYGKGKQKSEFGIGILFQALEKTPEGERNSTENNILDVEKLRFLNTSITDKERLHSPEFWRWYSTLQHKIHHYHLKLEEKKDHVICEERCAYLQNVELPRAYRWNVA